MPNLTATDLLYPVFLVMMFILTVIFIPRQEYKRYLVYGLIVGGIGDVVAVTLYQNILGVMWFQNQGLFFVLGHHALSPLGWTLCVMVFLYFLPDRNTFLYPYILAWAGLSLAYGYVVRNAHLFDFKEWFYPLPGYITFVIWWSFAAWFFLRTQRAEKKRDSDEK